MKINRIAFILLFFTLGNLSFLSAQFQNQYFQHRQLIEGKSNELYLAMRASGFFNNNEFFDTYVEGYTLIGNYFQPVLYYYFSPDFSVSGGAHLLKYHGQEGFANVRPWLSVHYHPSEKLRISLGSFNKGAILDLPEPLYMFENQFTDLTGSGIMIDYRGKWWNSVSWLDWISFIEQGDPFREEFVFGHSGAFTLFGDESHSLKIPYYILAEHKGGQINISDEPVETRMDFGGGLEWSKDYNLGIFNKILLKADIYYEKAPRDAIDGMAASGYGGLEGELFSFGLGYLNEQNWESILGQALFFSPEENTTRVDDRQQFILFKAGIGKRIGENSSFTIRFEGYYDPGIQRMQYTYGLFIVVDEWIRLFSPEHRTARAY